MKILHLAYDLGGIHTRLYHDIITAFREAGHDVVEVYLTGRPAEDYRSPANRVLSLGFAPSALKGLRRLLAVHQLREFIQTEGFEAIITHRRKPAELAARASKGMTLAGRFAVWHDEGEFKHRRKSLGAARLFREFTLIGVSEAVRTDILASRAGFAPEQVIAIDNAIDVANLEPRLASFQEARARLNLPENAFVFGTIGRLVPKKGHADLIRAFAPIAAEHSEAHLVLVGQGREAEHLQSLVSELRLAARVHLTGAIPEAFRYATGFDVFVLPSYREGLPIALLEAACARRPCLASDIGGNRVVLEGLGPLVRPGDIEGLTKAMRDQLAQSEAQLKLRGEALYQRLRQRFDRPVMVAAYRSLLPSA